MTHQVSLHLARDSAVPFVEGPQGDLTQEMRNRRASVAEPAGGAEFAAFIMQQPIGGGRAKA
jgi:hypothetical protein